MALEQTQQKRGSDAAWDGVNVTLPDIARESHNQLTNEARADVIFTFLDGRESRSVRSVALRSAPESGEDKILNRSITVKREPCLSVMGAPRSDGGVLRQFETKDGFLIWLSDRTDLCGPAVEITSDGVICSNCTIFRADDIIMALLKSRDNN